ncbi:MAG: hypothetical protein GWO24_24440, partial [Akkermansiaceae bacterium]|nr:hypothetical protein [Akkermansiaceae bacterium]
MTLKTTIPVLACALLLFLSPGRGMGAEPELKSWLGSAFSVPGEKTELWLWVVSETRPAESPRVPASPSVTIRLIDDHALPQR